MCLILLEERLTMASPSTNCWSFLSYTMFLTDLLENEKLGNVPSSTSEYTFFPISVRSFWALLVLASAVLFLASAVLFLASAVLFLASAVLLLSAVLFDFLLLNLLLLLCHLSLGFNPDCLRLRHLSLHLALHLLCLSHKFLVVREFLKTREVCGEPRYQREILPVDVHLALNRLHAPLPREVDAEAPQGLPRCISQLLLYLGAVGDVLLPDGLVGDLRRRDVSYHPEGGVLGDVVPPPVYLLVHHLEADVARLVV